MPSFDFIAPRVVGAAGAWSAAGASRTAGTASAAGASPVQRASSAAGASPVAGARRAASSSPVVEHVAVARAPLDALPDPLALARLLRGESLPWMLESALVQGRLGRHSFVGADPYAVLTARGRALSLDVRRPVRVGWPPGHHAAQGDPFEAVRALWPRIGPGALPCEADLPFVGGAVALFGYELAEQVEAIGLDQVADLDTADLVLLLVDRMVSIDHANAEAFAIATGFGRSRSEAEARAEAAVRALGSLVEHAADACIGAVAVPSPSAAGAFEALAVSASDAVDAGPGRERYGESVASVLDDIARGDVYEVNLTQRMSRPWRGDPLDLYAALREENPSPFAAFVELPDVCIVGSSPERFLRLWADGHVESRPIKGTRPRGDTPDRDAELAEALVTSPKDRAENLMIVDLVRNDLGRVCRPGSVRVPELMQVEAYATVFQLVSTVVGRMREDRDAMDLVRACFPPGSMTGAPKIAAMKIAGALEPVRRGLYSGALGYLDLRGGLDLSVTIRTLLVKKGRAYLHVGGAVVADSDPGAEYDETLDKARALQAALDRTTARSDGTPGAADKAGVDD